MRKKIFSTTLIFAALLFYSCGKTKEAAGDWQALDTKTADTFFAVNFVNDQVGWLNAFTDRNFSPIGDAADNQNANKAAAPKSQTKADTKENAARDSNKTDPLKANGGFEVLQTTDGGATWNQLPDQFKYKIRLVRFVDQQNGWALTIDRDILRTTDGGKSWTVQRKAGKVQVKITGNRRTPISEQPEQLEQLYFLDLNHGWAWGGGRKDEYAEQPGIFLTTVDGGQHWNQIAYPFKQQVFQAFFLNAQNGWVSTSDGEFYRTTDGGLNWSAIQTKRPDSTFDSIFFVDENEGWVVGTSGRLAKTTDGGKTWQKMVYIKDEFKMHAIYFLDKNEGWAVGENGDILYTSDGGENWRNYKSPTGGTLRQLVFVNKNVGYAAGLGGAVIRYAVGG